MACFHNDRRVFGIYSGATLYECSECHLVFLDTSSQRLQPERLYEEYYKNETGGRFNFGIEYVIRMFRFFRALKVFLLSPDAKSILDIGSGRGFMLYYLKRLYGYRTAVGTQLSKNALEFSRNRLGLEIYDRDFLEIPFKESGLDVVTMWHVLEHVPHPEEYIAKICRSLSENGKVIIEVPNLNSWTARLTGPYWLGLDLRYHLYFFSPATLTNLLKKNGFKIKTVHTFSLEYSIFISASSIVSWLTRTDHLLFEWLQTGRFKPVLFWHIALFAIVLPFCFLIDILLFFSKRGEVLLIVGQKEASV